jgi:hypothetical protein
MFKKLKCKLNFHKLQVYAFIQYHKFILNEKGEIETDYLINRYFILFCPICGKRYEKFISPTMFKRMSYFANKYKGIEITERIYVNNE